MKARHPQAAGVALISPAWIVMAGLLILPLLILIYVSLRQKGAIHGFAPIPDVWTYVTSGELLANYRRSIEPTYLAIYWRSLWMAMVTTALCLVISYPMAYFLALRVPARYRTLLLGLMVIPFWTSFLVRTYAWMLILRTKGLLNTILLSCGIIDAPLDLLYTETAVLIGLVYGELPFMILPLYASLEKLDPHHLEASRDLGAPPWSTFWRVTLPLSAPGVIAGIVLVFIPSIGQFVVSDLLGGAKSMLAGNLIQNQFALANNKPFGAAIALQLTAWVLVLLVIALRLARKRGGASIL